MSTETEKVTKVTEIVTIIEIEMVASKEEVAHLEGAIEEVGYQGYRDSNYDRDGGFKRGGAPPRGATEEVGYQGYRDSY